MLNSEATNRSEWERDENWHTPLDFYFSRLDTRTMVPKRREGEGVTVNLAHTKGWWWLVVLLVLPLTYVILSRINSLTR